VYFCKRCLWPTLAFSTISSIAIGQEVTKLRVVSEERIPQSVYDKLQWRQRDTIQCGVNQSCGFLRCADTPKPYRLWCATRKRKRSKSTLILCRTGTWEHRVLLAVV